MSKFNDFYKLFKPEITPKQMLEYGVFEGSYLGNKINEYPKSWFIKAKLSKKYEVDLNYFQIRVELSLKEWKKRVGLCKKIHGDGFNRIVVTLLEEECQK